MKARLLPCLALSLFAGPALAADSVGARLERIRTLAVDLMREVDSLEREFTARPRPTASPGDSGRPILGEIMSGRELKLAAAAGTPFQRLAAGYSFDPDMPIAMHFLDWEGNWGWSVGATARFSPGYRLAGGEVAVLRGLHRFALFEGLQTHLYAFAAAGGFWRRQEFNDYFGTVPGPRVSGPEWYDNPDAYARLRLGAGSELGLLTLGGVKAAPEVGFQAQRYFSRYQDSRAWEGQYALNPGFEEKPQSDYSLGLYFAFHLNFYFL